MNAVNSWGSISTQANFVLSPVPEPGTWALSVLGMAALIGVARRRRSVSH